MINIKHLDQKKNRVGELSSNKYGSVMKITKYNSAIDVEVEFENGYMAKCYYYDFKNGGVFNPLDITSYGVGYFGIGEYNSSHHAYYVWKGMFKRCYDEKYLQKYETYRGCSVCEEWYDYQNFAKWYYENYYEIDTIATELDKDILQKGNKIYSPDTCVFTPKEINYLFVKRNKSRGKYPIGVYLHTDKDKYVAGFHSNGRSVYLGRYETVEEAFMVYKYHKEKVIKETADKYKDKIPNNLYEAMYKYIVEIND
ncbi:AP2 domain-containing protein [Paenibacillus tianjinensis]|uniref:AP2 domain-containing protein n=1 Tax=Paenibacillus tianjinensis TaxID=2810347 RepID=A0ABX7L6T7_9BACL|nr:AP2 domain-containing protein [Paenibacillus tianjinensis]QSF43491.1 hypothetical protein JRJ22_19705 [Paenibacillus tianjinensis]